MTEPSDKKPGHPPKIVHVVTADQYGGAAKSAYRIHASLRRLGADSTMLVRQKGSNDPTVTAVTPETPEEIAWDRNIEARIAAERRQWMSHLGWGLAFYTDRGRENLALMRHLADADLIHLHWVASNFVDIPHFFRDKDPSVPVVWRLPDIAPLTGGCHFTAGCVRYRESCGCCPVLNSTDAHDLTHEVIERKKAAIGAYGGQLHFVGPCSWMTETIRQSAVAKERPASTILNGVDTNIFRPVDGTAFREHHGIGPDTVLLTMAAFSLAEERKGTPVFLEALSGLADLDIAVAFVGEEPPEGPHDFPTIAPGHIDDRAELLQAYAASDIVVVPSLADNLPNVIFEAMACGRAVVASDVGGIADIVHQGETGMLVPAGDSTALAAVLRDLIRHPEKRQTLGARARQYCLENLSLDCEGEAYIALYESLLKRPVREER